MTRGFTQERADGHVRIRAAAPEGAWRPAARHLRFVVQLDRAPSHVAVDGTEVPRASGGGAGWSLDPRGFLVVDVPDPFAPVAIDVAE